MRSGCTDPTKIGYDASANTDDGSCMEIKWVLGEESDSCTRTCALEN